VDSEAKTSAARQEASTAEEQDGEPGKLGSTEDAPATDEQITELRREIESGRQNIEDLEAFAQMERTKLENDPDYDPSFLQEALQEQEHLRETIESGESRLQELTRPNE